jgi:DnaJ-class molecular chaperone
MYDRTEICGVCGERGCEGYRKHYEVCTSCAGSGSYDIGDCEDGIQEDCPECDGSGEVSINA